MDKEQIKTLIKEYVDDTLSEWCTENSQILEPWHQLVEDLSFIAVKAIQKISEHYNFVEKTKETVIEGWLARDRDDKECICFFEDEPWEEYNLLYKHCVFTDGGDEILLPDKFMPDLTYKDSPQKVRITITPIEE